MDQCITLSDARVDQFVRMNQPVRHQDQPAFIMDQSFRMYPLFRMDQFVRMDQAADAKMDQPARHQNGPARQISERTRPTDF